MKVKYIVNPRGKYESDKIFTFDKEYKVLADYRQRQSGQKIADNGFVVIDNQGQKNMLFQNEVEIIEDNEKCYTFSYN
jgi:hypothetical protein